MERDGFEPLSARRHARQRGLRAIGAALELDRVDPELVGGEVGEQFRGDAGERHADAAIHADQVLVDVDAAGAGLVVVEAVRGAHDGDRHHALGDIEAQRHPIGADGADVVHLHGEDLAGLFQRDPAFEPVVARLGVGYE